MHCKRRSTRGKRGRGVCANYEERLVEYFIALIESRNDHSILQLERMQNENAVEWEKRERMESEKLSLERDNKKLRGEVREMQDRLERRGRGGPTNGGDTELRVLQQELIDKNKVGDLSVAEILVTLISLIVAGNI